MRLIPVIDLLDGRVVHARRGERHHYRPLHGPLCPDADPHELLHRLCALASFTRVYLADLDAITGGEPQRALVAALAAEHPGLELWLDAALADAAAVHHWRAHGVTPVIGSESLAPAQAAFARDQEAVLSLDFGPEGFRGPPELLERPELWPRRVIAMTLARVGADVGPDLETLRRLRERAGSRELYAAGGLRDADDLRALEDAGVAGVLSASALHTGRIPSALLRRYA